ALGGSAPRPWPCDVGGAAAALGGRAGVGLAVGRSWPCGDWCGAGGGLMGGGVPWGGGAWAAAGGLCGGGGPALLGARGGRARWVSLRWVPWGACTGLHRR